MKLSETEGVQRQQRLDYIRERWQQLHEQTSEKNKEALTYLMVTNSGGAVAILSFMGAMKSLTPFPGAVWMLLSFMTGVVLVGIGRAIAYYRLSWLFSKWNDDVQSYYEDEIAWSSLLSGDTTRTKGFVWADIVAWSCFACFLAGLTIGMVGVIKHTPL